jgi:hypothetical protein
VNVPDQLPGQLQRRCVSKSRDAGPVISSAGSAFTRYRLLFLLGIRGWLCRILNQHLASCRRYLRSLPVGDREVNFRLARDGFFGDTHGVMKERPSATLLEYYARNERGLLRVIRGKLDFGYGMNILRYCASRQGHESAAPDSLRAELGV